VITIRSASAVNQGPGRQDGPSEGRGKRIAIYSLVLNLLLAAAKYLLYLYGGSTAVLAEAVHSLTDVVGSLLVIGGMYLSEKKSMQFPWGLYKTENLAAVLSSVMILLSAYEIASMIVRPAPVALRNLDSTMIALLLMAFPIVLFSRYEAKMAAAVNSPALMADAENWRTDLAPLAVVAAGIGGARLSFAAADSIAAVVVLVLVVKAGYGILKDSMKSLLDASVDSKTVERMRGVVKGFPQVREPFTIQARNSGRFIFVEISVNLALTRLKEAYKIALDLEREIKDKIPFVERAIVHVEPEKKDFLRHAAPLADREGAISEHFAKAPFIAFWDVRISDGAVVSQEILENPFVQLEKGKGIKLAEHLVTMKIDVLYTKENFEGKGPEYVFADAGIEIRKAHVLDLKDLMDHKPEKIPMVEVLS
jgi:cation diffusion facilitator family transporter